MRKLKLTYKQKNTLLLISILVCIPVFYNLSIKKTLQAYFQCSELEAKNESSENIALEIKELKMQLTRMGREGAGSVDTLQLGGDAGLISAISAECRQRSLTLVTIKPTLSGTKDDYRISTKAISLKGEYTDLLKCIYDIEYKYQLGRVMSVNFHSKTNYTSKELELHADICLQTINKILS